MCQGLASLHTLVAQSCLTLCDPWTAHLLALIYILSSSPNSKEGKKKLMQVSVQSMGRKESDMTEQLKYAN